MQEEIIWSALGLLVGIIAFLCSAVFRSMVKSSFSHPLRESRLVYQSGTITEAPPANVESVESHAVGVR